MTYDNTDGRLRGRKAVERRRLFLLKHPLCEWCKRKGKITPAEELDHIIPLYKGGPDTEENLSPKCKACHAEKTAQDMGYVKKEEIGLDGFPVD